MHPHESPRVMTVPLIVLAVLSAAGRLDAAVRLDPDLLAPVVGEEPHHEARDLADLVMTA